MKAFYAPFPTGGLLVRVTAPQRPAFRMEYRAARGDLALRVVAKDTPLLWFDIDDWWSFLTMKRLGSGPGVVAPIRSRPVVTDWEKYFAEALIASGCSPLHAGHFLVKTLDRKKTVLPPLMQVRKTFERGEGGTAYDHGYTLWALRAPSPETSGRVKMWRKKARAGTLPPLLVLHVSPLEGYLLLDGHDRLLAAILEKKDPPVVGVVHLRKQQPQIYDEWQKALLDSLGKADQARFSQETLDRFNRQLITAFGGDQYEVRTRCWPMAKSVTSPTHGMDD